MKINLNKRVLVTIGIALFSFSAHAGLIKWIKREALPTISGQRPIVIRPYISVKSGSTQIKFGENSAMIKVGGVTVQTSKLRLRLVQAACVYATAGDIMTCAPDVIDRESKKLFGDIANGTEIPDAPPIARPGSTIATGTGATANNGLKSEDDNMRDVPWGPPGASIGFDFSNPGTKTIGGPTASAFLHTIAVARSRNSAGKAMVDIVGRADFAFMTGKQGGVICNFASERGKYLTDSNSEYTDQYDVISVGGTVRVERSPDLVPFQLSIPWSELKLPNGSDPYATKYVQCHITVDNEVTQSTEWIAF